MEKEISNIMERVNTVIGEQLKYNHGTMINENFSSDSLINRVIGQTKNLFLAVPQQHIICIATFLFLIFILYFLKLPIVIDRNDEEKRRVSLSRLFRWGIIIYSILYIIFCLMKDSIKE